MSAFVAVVGGALDLAHFWANFSLLFIASWAWRMHNQPKSVSTRLNTQLHPCLWHMDLPFNLDSLVGSAFTGWPDSMHSTPSFLCEEKSPRGPQFLLNFTNTISLHVGHLVIGASSMCSIYTTPCTIAT